MDAGGPAVRRSAIWLGHVMRVGRVMCRAIHGVWRTFGGSNFLLNTMAVCVAVCCGLLTWWAVFDPIVPLKDAVVVRVEPKDRIIDRDKDDTMTITRRVCMDRGAWGNVSRYFISQDGSGIEYKLAPSSSVFLPSGCHERSREMDVPGTLPPGHYVIRSAIEFCNKLRCQDAWVQDIPVLIRGAWPAAPMGPPAAIREPF